MVSERAMREIYLTGFGICVREAQLKADQTSYNVVNGSHTDESRGVIMDILRAEFGYEGIVMTEWVLRIEGDARCAHRDSQAQYIATAGDDLFMARQQERLRQSAAGDLERRRDGRAAKNQHLVRGQNAVAGDTRIKHKNLDQIVVEAEVFWIIIHFGEYSIVVWQVTSGKIQRI